jgi:hypothetical protein
MGILLMAIEKLGNPKLKNQGNQGRTQVNDLSVQLLLEKILLELQEMNLHLSCITEEEFKHRDIIEETNL